jgi:hypothetical protein
MESSVPQMLDACIELKERLKELGDSEPHVYDAETHYYWSKEFHGTWDDLYEIEGKIKEILDAELKEYFAADPSNSWSKTYACKVLKRKLEHNPRLSMTLEDFFLYLINATVNIPEEYKEQVIYSAAQKLQEWDTISSDQLRDVLSELNYELP